MNFIEDLKKSLSQVVETVGSEYRKNQTKKTKMVDAWCAYCLATCAVQILYMLTVGSYPFNSFLAGLFCHIAMFGFGMSLRFQITSPGNFASVTPERALADFVFCHLVLFFIVWSFMG